MSVNAAQRKATRRYVAPARALNPNEVLKPEDLIMIEWPGDVEVPGAFTKTTDVAGRTILYPVDKGEPITDKLLSAPGVGPGLAGRIPDGMRAVALRTDEVIGVAGFLSPGSRLDVLATYHSDLSPGLITATVLQNAEVLATGHQMEPDPSGKAIPVTVVTLLLTPQDAEKVVLATTQGTIHFVMRSGTDAKIGKSAPIEMSQLTPGQPASPTAPTAPAPHKAHRHAPAPAAPPPLDSYKVEMVLGDKIITNTFQAGAR
jgi:pilus assembly protein CpaB